ncbi:unnamed protein product [Echinostoma caproni]|uniref:Ribosome biogenesis protein SLX9 n=1 Tax=Echinostoma caproni TaxID=27848 RepID=A0A183ATG1_9TREM|nr:unnamed protein product [Echinostoma caproni]
MLEAKNTRRQHNNLDVELALASIRPVRTELDFTGAHKEPARKRRKHGQNKPVSDTLGEQTGIEDPVVPQVAGVKRILDANDRQEQFSQNAAQGNAKGERAPATGNPEQLTQRKKKKPTKKPSEANWETLTKEIGDLKA